MSLVQSHWLILWFARRERNVWLASTERSTVVYTIRWLTRSDKISLQMSRPSQPISQTSAHAPRNFHKLFNAHRQTKLMFPFSTIDSKRQTLCCARILSHAWRNRQWEISAERETGPKMDSDNVKSQQLDYSFVNSHAWRKVLTSARILDGLVCTSFSSTKSIMQSILRRTGEVPRFT